MFWREGGKSFPLQVRVHTQYGGKPALLSLSGTKVSNVAAARCRCHRDSCQLKGRRIRLLRFARKPTLGPFLLSLIASLSLCARVCEKKSVFILAKARNYSGPREDGCVRGVVDDCIRKARYTYTRIVGKGGRTESD